MAEGFSELGLRPELVRAVEAAGFAAPTTLQRAAVPVIRRGGNAVVQASSGSGVTAAWALPLLDRLAESVGERAAEGEGAEGPAPAPRALVVAATEEHAARLAETVAAFAMAAGLDLGALVPGWAAPTPSVDVLVASVDGALERVRVSGLKLERVEAMVLVGASALLALVGLDALEPLTQSLPRDAQRLVTTGEVNGAVEDLVERHVRRALWVPPRPTERGAPEAQSQAAVGFATVREEEKPVRLAALLDEETLAGPIVVFCRTDERAAEVAQMLAVRGFRIGAAGETGIQAVVAAADADPSAVGDGTPVSYDVPFDTEQLVARHGRAGGVVLLGARELPHLRRIAREAGMTPRPFRGAAAAERRAAGPLAAYREQLRQAAEEEDLEAQLLVLGPLVDELSPLDLAAAASALLRRRGALPGEPAASGEAQGSRGLSAASAGGGEPRGAPPPRAFVRLFVSLGERDRIRPGDLVGAIAGEAGIPGGEVGKIEVRDTFSIVEVPSDAAQRVIRGLNGTTLKGRSVRVDYDRKQASAGKPRGTSGPGRPRQRPARRGGDGEG